MERVLLMGEGAFRRVGLRGVEVDAEGGGSGAVRLVGDIDDVVEVGEAGGDNPASSNAAAGSFQNCSCNFSAFHW